MYHISCNLVRFLKKCANRKFLVVRVNSELHSTDKKTKLESGSGNCSVSGNGKISWVFCAIRYSYLFCVEQAVGQGKPTRKEDKLTYK